MRALTAGEQAMLDNARPSERVVIRDLFELLDARLVTEGDRGQGAGNARLNAANVVAPAVGLSPSVTEPLFAMHETEEAA